MLVELQHRTRAIGRSLHGGELVQRFGGGDDPARVHGAVTRQAVDLVAESHPAIPERLAARADVRAQQRGPARVGGELCADRLHGGGGVAPLQLAPSFVHERLGESEGEADVARGGARAIGDEGADECHVSRSEALQHRIDHLIAPIGGEVHIHVRVRLAPLIQEALEDQVVADRIHARDPKEIRDHRIARTPATLRGDPVRMCVPHDLRTEQEELGEPRPLDGGELTRNAALQIRAALWISARHTSAHLARKLFVGTHASREIDPRKAHARKVQVNICLCDNRSGAIKRRTPHRARTRMRGEQLRPCAQVRLRLRETERTEAMDGEAVADASERIEQFAFARQRTARGGAGNHWQAAARSECRHFVQEPRITAHLVIHKL